MELGEGDARMCRLCGQYESMYIDVFSDEGTKRLLGLKIHSKINILIDERDPLPKAICVQCLGKLEFVCDFQEECLRTQHVLRDRYNLPPLTEIAEVKTEETAPSTSTNNNNNDIDKNLNPPAKENVREVAQRVSKTTAKTQRNLRSQHQANIHSNGIVSSGSSNSNNNGIEAAKDQTTIESATLDNTDNIEIVQSTGNTATRWLRSRQNTETTLTNEITIDTPIANRLRSHVSTAAEISVNSPRSNSSETSGKQQDPNNTIQIPTSALNKLLTIVSNSPNIEVSAKESRSQSNDTEDISFTVELCKKESDDIETVRARVFPDQGSCLVDESIVGLLQNQACVEVNSIINTILSSSLKNGSSTKSKDAAEFEQKWQASQKPEHLFKIDGEEIRVDDNVEHIVTDSQNGYSCKLCCKFYERKDKCMVHVKTHLGIKQYTCILCNAKFVCKSDVMKHIRCSHTNPRPIQCPKCPKRFKSKFYLMEHDNVHKGVRPYACTDCGQSYHHKVSLQIHMKSHLPPQNLACEYCGKVFPYRTRLLSHIASVHLKNRRNFRCRFCYNLYSSLSVLNEHIKTRHATTYTCEVCTKTFKVASKYKAHVLQHTNPKPFVCTVCNNRYASKAFLNEHLLKHEGLRKHICQKCGARFAQASHLAAHRHVHGEKKHACPECGRKFNRRDNMKITANDGLPHVVCLRCIGALEFLCDFYNCCQLTQRKLSLQQAVNKYLSENTPRRTPREENDAEFNKENVLPSSSGTKRRCKVASPGKKDQPTNENRLDVRKQSATNNAGVQEQNLQEGQSNENASAQGNPLPIKDTSKEGSKFFDSCTVPMKKGEANDKIALAKPKRLVRSQKRQLKTLGGVFKSSNSIKQSQEGSNETKHDENPPKRQCLSVICRNSTSNVSDETGRDANPRKRQSLGAICTNGTSNVTKNAATLSKPQIELPLENKVATIPSNKDCIKTNDVNKDLIGDVVEVASKGESSNAERKEEDSTESKPILIIVKQERTDVEVISQETEKPNQLVWIPTEILTEGQTICQDQEIDVDLSLRLSPEPLDDDTENSELVVTARTESNDSNCTNYTEKPDTSLSSKEQTRATVIRSSRGSPAPVIVKPDASNNIEGTKNDSKTHRESSWGVLSKMLSAEQRQEIETYYRIDMSVVNAEEVQKNLTVVNKKDIRCNICGTVYLRMDKCQVHIWGHLQMKPYKCKACNFVTVTVSNMRTHIRKSHLKIKPYECNVCGKNFTTYGLMMEHINGHTGNRPFVCNICDYRCTTRQMLAYHNNANHKPIKEVNCKICGVEFYSRSKLRTHMLVHKKDKMIMCKICSAYLSNERALEAHHKNLHTQEYVCDICGKHMKSRKALNNHLNVHSTGKHKCTLCPNVYKSSQILKEHLLKHEGIRKYTCGECGKTFGQLSHLAAHKAVHSGIRYNCPGCEKPFNRHDNMKIHTKRCKPFLANPELKKLILKKESSPSTSKVNTSTEDTTSKDSASSNSESFIEKQTDNEEISIKTVDDKEETAMKLGLNISCIESPDKPWIRDNAYEEVGELMGSNELSAIQIVEPNDTFTLENDNVRVLEIL